MSNRAVHQLPLASTTLEGDLLHAVRDPNGTPTDLAVPVEFVGLRVYKAVANISSTQILAGFTTPVLVIPVPTSTQILVPLYAIQENIDCSIAYATNTDFVLGPQGTLSGSALVFTGSLPSSSDDSRLLMNTGSATTTQMAIGEALYFKVLSGNPTLGDGDIRFTVYYHKIEV